MTSATLDQITGGRFVLGLGVSTPALAEGLHDTPFAHPAERLASTITGVRALLAGEPARLHTVPTARALRLGIPPAPTVPIWVGALSPGTLRVTAEAADGWLPALVARDRLAALVAGLRADRELPLTVVAGPITVSDEDSGTARHLAAACVAWYVCAMGDVYARSLTNQGYGAEVRAIRAANPRPSPRSCVIPAEAEQLLTQLAVTGAPGHLDAQLESWHELADVVMLGIPPGIPWPVIESTLRAGAPRTAHRQRLRW
jgi:alkanesulfonate monooxygenase SsuD/methylene tetrahydromethanopterin reductase-like flavin-dependent oxidoreductase (luciferase family)